MTTSRRNFLKTTGLSAAALAIGSHKLMAAADPDVYLAIQLYSVREDMGKDPSQKMILPINGNIRWMTLLLRDRNTWFPPGWMIVSVRI